MIEIARWDWVGRIVDELVKDGHTNEFGHVCIPGGRASFEYWYHEPSRIFLTFNTPEDESYFRLRYL